MPNVFTFTPQKSQKGSSQPVFSVKTHKSHGGVVQDNAALPPARSASVQPDTHRRTARAALMETVVVRSQLHNKNEEKLERVVTYVRSRIKAELDRLTKQWQQKEGYKPFCGSFSIP